MKTLGKPAPRMGQFGHPFRKVKTATHNFIMEQGRAAGNLAVVKRKEPNHVRKGK